MANVPLFLLQMAVWSFISVQAAVAGRVSFDITAGPGYTIPSLFSLFSSNEAQTRKKQTSGCFGKFVFLALQHIVVVFSTAQ
jgi:hypothetical protein